MDKQDHFERLSQAADLLIMLERLAEAFSESEVPQKEVPWAGISHTLTRSRKIVQETSEELLRNICAEALPTPRSAALNAGDKFAAPTRMKSSLSGRIKRVPSSN
jgi:hypothetical protein